MIELMRAGFTTDGFEAYPVTRDLNKRGVPKDVPGPFPRSIIPSLVGTTHFSTYDPFTVPTDLVRIKRNISITGGQVDFSDNRETEESPRQVADL